MADALIKLDETIFILVNQDWAAGWLDSVMILLSSRLAMIPLYLGLIYLGWKKFKRNVWIPVLLFFLSFAASDSISSRVFKPAFKRVRPCNIEHLHARIPDTKSQSYGFVSSHAANMAAIAFVFAFFYKPGRRWKWLAFGIAGMVAYSRVYLGVHFPGDVLCGYGLGVLLAWLVCRAAIQIPMIGSVYRSENHS